METPTLHIAYTPPDTVQANTRNYTLAVLYWDKEERYQLICSLLKGGDCTDAEHVSGESSTRVYSFCKHLALEWTYDRFWLDYARVKGFIELPGFYKLQVKAYSVTENSWDLAATVETLAFQV